MEQRTIFALSSGSLPCGVAVIRLSGSKTRFVLETLTGALPLPRKACLRTIKNVDGSEVLDVGIVIWFPGPKSFTGEDSAELQVHGGVAVVNSLLDTLSKMDGLHAAEPGEFTRQAFENSKLDLVGLEGLSDLIGSQTENQRKQALGTLGGQLSRRLEDWRKELISMRALIEAELDFADEDDVPGSVSDQVWERAGILAGQMRDLLKNSKGGAIVRDGFKVVIMGEPNAGKSSLLNALAKEEIAIVTPQEGTTRDIISVDLDVDGYLVRVTDTAGIRDTEDIVEQEGIRRARLAGESADLIIWLAENRFDSLPEQYGDVKLLKLLSKDDMGRSTHASISAKTGYGIDKLFAKMRTEIEKYHYDSGDIILSRVRQNQYLEQALHEIELAVGDGDGPLDLRAENLRRAGEMIGKVTGKIDVEDLLDVIFSEFCIGK